MTFHQRHGLQPVINARGSFTPLGVSRSSPQVAHAAAEALGQFVVMDDLQAVLSERVARSFGAEAACATHCVAAAITLAVAASMTGDDATRIAALPSTDGLPNRIVIPAGHAVDYGHPILTDIRLAGATPVLAGSERGCDTAQLEAALAAPDVACLLLVSSRLVRGEPVDLAAAVAAAHRRGVPAIIDGAAQDWRIDALLATGADLVLVSAHKYLASPTCGLIIGRRRLVDACRAQERGIGRAMKPTKEAMVGVLAALDERQRIDVDAWRDEQQRKLQAFIARADVLNGLEAVELPDPSGMPFSRLALTVLPSHPLASATRLAEALRRGEPPIWVMEHAAADGVLILELVALRDDEVHAIFERLLQLGRAADPGQR